jgi:hypothetical protein
MKIDLSKFVGQEVEATLQCGEKIVGVVTYKISYRETELNYKVGLKNFDTFTVDGFYQSDRYPFSPCNIIKIKPMKKYQKLEQQVEDLQKEIERLKEEEKENTLPKDFILDRALSFLDCPNFLDLVTMFTWHSSPQGQVYWEDLYTEMNNYQSESGDNPDYKVPDEAIIQIQKWVIEFYRNKLR